MTASIIYKGDLRCEATHLQSGSIIETDAPTDNRGKGERFSPTDLLCVSLGTCIITTMGIKAGDMGIDLRDSKMEVTKHMLPDPRRVGGIDVIIHLPAGLNLEEKDRLILERSGDNCPVQKSISSAMNVSIKYNWG
jgi:putative redox protein